jgi:hypothetical protein
MGIGVRRGTDFDDANRPFSAGIGGGYRRRSAFPGMPTFAAPDASSMHAPDDFEIPEIDEEVDDGSRFSGPLEW